MLELGRSLFEKLNGEQWVGNQKPVVYGEGGITISQIAEIEAQLGFPLPPDFAYLLQNMRDDGEVFFPWSKFIKTKYDEFIEWIVQGIEFDIDSNNLWLRRWGERPTQLSDAYAVARSDFANWPKLLPLSGHRFLAAEPCEAGNPIFSIMQTDIIYYGSNLAHYLVNEFLDHDWHAHTQGARYIEVWSDFAEDRDVILASGWGKKV